MFWSRKTTAAVGGAQSSPPRKVLPPVESTPVILLRFTSKADDELIALVEDRLVEGGLKVVAREVDVQTNAEDNIGASPPEAAVPTTTTVLGLTTAHEALQTEAQSIRLIRRRVDTGVMEALNPNRMDLYCEQDIPNRDEYGLFNSNDWSLLTWRILEDVTVLPLGAPTSKLSQKFDSLKVSYRRPLAYSYSFTRTQTNPMGASAATSSKTKSLKRLKTDLYGDAMDSNSSGSDGKTNVTEERYPTQGLAYVLERAGLVDVVSSIHQPELRDAVYRKTRSIFSLSPPADDIRQYYGEEIAFYFAWMGFLYKWLLFPGVMGVGAYCYRWYREDDIMHDEYTPFYGLITFLWAVTFVKYWKREESRLSYDWGTLMGEHEKQAFFATRPEFYGRLRVSPVTGQLEVFYPAFRRRVKYVVSALVTLFMLTVAFTAMICSLNLQGYINPKNDPSRWHSGNTHPFHFPRLAKLAEPGQLFDATSTWRSLIPVVMHVATIFSLNNIYRIVATGLTKWENHQTELSFENSLILKRFLFEAFDCYIALFYLAFYERNIDKLRVELVSVFNIDTVRRLGLECILPYVLQKLGKRKKHEEQLKKKERGIPVADSTPLTDESEADPYEQFDE